MDKLVTASYTLEKNQIDEIEDLKFKGRYQSKSEVVRKALEIGLGALKDGGSKKDRGASDM